MLDIGRDWRHLEPVYLICTPSGRGTLIQIQELLQTGRDTDCTDKQPVEVLSCVQVHSAFLMFDAHLDQPAFAAIHTAALGAARDLASTGRLSRSEAAIAAVLRDLAAAGGQNSPLFTVEVRLLFHTVLAMARFVKSARLDYKKFSSGHCLASMRV